MKTALILAVTVYGLLPSFAFANEFGDYFYNKTPAGLGDYTTPESEIPDIAMDEIAKDLQLIMPAAGDNSDNSDDGEMIKAEKPLKHNAQENTEK